MADIVAELTAIGQTIQAALPSVVLKYQHVPEQPTAGVLVVRLADDSVTTETSYHYRIDRSYQLVYFGTSETDCLRQMEAIKLAVNDNLKIPYNDTDYITISGFGASQPSKSDSGAFFVLAIVRGTVRQARTQPNATKISDVSVATKE